MTLNLKEKSTNDLKAFTWDLRQAIDEYTQALQTVNQEIFIRIQQQQLQEQQQKAIKTPNEKGPE